MNLYFYDSAADQDPFNTNNWWDNSGGSGTNGYTPSSSDDCYIDAGQTCSTSNFSYSTLYVNGVLSNNVSSKTVTNNSSGVVTSNSGTVSDNYGTVTDNESGAFVSANFGTVTNNKNGATITSNQAGATVTDNQSGSLIVDNYGNVVTNNGTISTRYNGGSTVNEYQIADIPAGYTVTNLYVSIDNNYGTIATVHSGCTLTYNGGVVTINSGSITSNFGTVTSNDSIVSTNTATIVTNSSSGSVYANSGTISTNNGTCRIGVIGGGTGNLSATSATNLSSHTAGTNVTFPTTPINWW